MQAQRVAAARRGKLYRVDGAILHLWGGGEGTPTVVIVTGAGVISLNWTEIVEAIAQLTSVVIYDRPGYGWSSTSSHPRTPEQAGRELAELLTAARIPPPYVLVGHSIGGLYVRHYARRRPETVAGMVLIDSSHERQVQLMPPELSARMQRLVRLASNRWIVQLVRPVLLLMACVGVLKHRELPWSVRRTMFAQQISLSPFRTGIEEADGMSSSERSPVDQLPPVPLVVLTAGRDVSRSMRASADVKARVRALWLQLQDELAALSPRSKHVVVEDSGHMIPDEKPQAVIDAVRSVVDEWRRDEKTAQGEAAGLL